MFKLRIRTNTDRFPEIIEELSNSPMDTLNKKAVNLYSCTVAMNGKILSTDDLNQSFDKLGVHPDDTIILSVVVKTEGAY